MGPHEQPFKLVSSVMISRRAEASNFSLQLRHVFVGAPRSTTKCATGSIGAIVLLLGRGSSGDDM